MGLVQHSGKGNSRKRVIQAAYTAISAAIGAGGTLTATGATFQPIALTGYNQKAIITVAQGAAAVTATMDNGTLNTGDTWYEKGWNTFNSSTGLPTSTATITSSNDSSHIYTMADYSNNDVLLIDSSSTTGTFTFNTSTNGYSALSFLTSSGNGATSFSVTINYSDGVSSSTGLSVTSPDWFNSTPVAFTAYGRDTRTSSPTAQPDSYGQANPRLYQEDITLPDSSDPIASIGLTYASGAGHVMVFAVSGVVSVSTPILTYTGATSPGVFDTSTMNFKQTVGGNTTPTAFVNGDAAIFDDTAVDTAHLINVSSGVQIGGMTVNSSSGYTFNGAGIGGSGGLTDSGSGTVTLNNLNTFTGATTVTAGTLVIGSDGALASVSLSVASGATLTVNSGGAFTAAAPGLTDNGTVNYAGSSLTLGTLSGTGALNLTGTNSGGPVATINGGSFTGSISGNGIGVTLGGAGGALGGTYNDGSSPNSLTINSTGTWVLSGSGSYSGGTTLTAGVARVSSSSGFGNGPIVANGGSVSSTVPVTIGNLITGGALVVASNSSTVELTSSANTFAGPVSVQGGILQIDSPGAIGGVTAANGLIVASGGALSINDQSGYAGLAGGVSDGAPMTVTLSGTGPGNNGALRTPDSGGTVPGGTGLGNGYYNSPLIWAGNVNISGPVNISPGVDEALALTGAITGDGTVLFEPSTGVTVGGTTYKDQYGSTIDLSPPSSTSNTYTGESQVGGESSSNALMTVQLGADNGFSPNAGLKINSGGAGGLYIDLNGHNQAVAYLTGSSQQYHQIYSSSGASVLTIDNGNSSTGPATCSTLIAGPITVVKTGSGNQILNGSNNYSGGTNIHSGILTAATINSVGSGIVTLSGGTLGLAGPAASTFSGFAGFQINRNSTAASFNAGSISGDNQTLNLNDNNDQEAISAFSPAPVGISSTQGFTASFLWNHGNLNTSPYSVADGFTFILQNSSAGASALGGSGGGLGYSGITPSVAVDFDTYSGYGSGFGTALSTNGVLPANDTYTSISPIVIQNEDIAVKLTYDPVAGTLIESLVGEDGSGNPTGNTYSHTYTGVNLSSILGGSTAYVGFGGGTGGVGIMQSITNFTFGAVSTTGGAGSLPNNDVVGLAGTSSGIQIPTSTGAVTATIRSITLQDGAVIAVTATGTAPIPRAVLATQSVTFATNESGGISGQLDIGSNDLDITGQSLQQVNAAVASGFDGGSWNGSGIASSAAAADPTHLTALGVISNSPNGVQLYGSGGAIASTFDGSNPGASDILVKYTYYGDANLDGAVDGSDYTLIDAGFNSDGALTGWYNGDFNYDGVIDGSDYTLIDNAFNTQGASLGSNPLNEIAGSSQTASVPEPATIGLLGMGAMAVLTRRRRRSASARFARA